VFGDAQFVPLWGPPGDRTTTGSAAGSKAAGRRAGSPGIGRAQVREQSSNVGHGGQAAFADTRSVGDAGLGRGSRASGQNATCPVVLHWESRIIGL
jgi:hypothetical protein